MYDCNPSYVTKKTLVLEITGEESNQTYMASAQNFRIHFGGSFT